MRYKVWDEVSPVITPIGEVFTAEQWMEKYPMARLPEIKLILGGGTINGSVCMEFSQTIETYKSMGCDFSDCVTDQNYCDRIEQFEDEMNTPDPDYVSPEEREAAALEAMALFSIPDEVEISATERIAAALEAQVMMSIPDSM